MSPVTRVSFQLHQLPPDGLFRPRFFEWEEWIGQLKIRTISCNARFSGTMKSVGLAPTASPATPELRVRREPHASASAVARDFIVAFCDDAPLGRAQLCEWRYIHKQIETTRAFSNCPIERP